MSRLGLVFSLLALAGCAPLGGAFDMTDARPRATTSADGTEVSYRVSGRGDRAIVLIHGWSCDQGYWDGLVPLLSADHTVLTVDLAGHGASGASRKAWTMANFGEDVIAAVNAAQLDRVVLVGHSMGGPVMLEAARRLGERTALMVGVDTLKDPDAVMTRDAAQALWGGFSANYAAAVNGFVRSQFFLPDADPALVDSIATDMASAPADIALAAGLELSMYDRADGLRATRDIPLTLLNADNPPTDETGYSEVRDEVSVVYLSSYGHFPMNEDPVAFDRALRDVMRVVLP
ncbi:MAG: alpha/beta hydrolase [Pseudomonadota bacterium]